MLKFLQIVSHWLASYTSIFIIAVALFAFIVPQTFSWVVGYTQTAILGIIMLTMGLTLSISDFKILVSRPLDIFIGACAQYTIMPLVAYVLTYIFGLDASLSIGIVLVGCCPGGVSSNIMSFLCKGDVAFSVGMTTVSTLVAPIATPIITNLLIGQSIDMDPWGMFIFMLIAILLPVAIGSSLNICFNTKKFFQDLRALMPGVAVIGFALIVGGVVAVHGKKFLESGLIIFACIFLHNSLGYILGFIAATVFKMNYAKRKTLAIEVGVQNAGLATALCGKFFPTSAEAAIASAVSCVWHSISGTILANAFLWYDKRKQKKIEFNEVTKKKNNINS